MAWGRTEIAVATLAAGPALAQTLELSEKGVLLERVAAVVNDGVVLQSQVDGQVAMISERLSALDAFIGTGKDRPFRVLTDVSCDKCGAPMETVCEEKARAKFDGDGDDTKSCFAKAEGYGDCLTPGGIPERDGMEVKADAFVKLAADKHTVNMVKVLLPNLLAFVAFLGQHPHSCTVSSFWNSQGKLTAYDCNETLTHLIVVPQAHTILLFWFSTLCTSLGIRMHSMHSTGSTLVATLIPDVPDARSKLARA